MDSATTLGAAGGSLAMLVVILLLRALSKKNWHSDCISCCCEVEIDVENDIGHSTDETRLLMAESDVSEA